MPGFDKTGPMGKGPLTGGGRGKCADTNTENNSVKETGKTEDGEIVYGIGRGGRPYGGGRGRCYGGGRRRKGNGRWNELNRE